MYIHKTKNQTCFDKPEKHAMIVDSHSNFENQKTVNAFVQSVTVALLNV